MEPFMIKSEPIDYDENNNNSHFVFHKTTEPAPSYIESQYQSEQFYINNIENVLLEKSQFDLDACDYMNDIMLSVEQTGLVTKPLPERNINLSDVFVQINNTQTSYAITKSSDYTLNKPKIPNFEIQKPKMQEQLAREKKRILLSLIDAASKEKKSVAEDYAQYEPMSQNEEEQLLRQLNHLLDSQYNVDADDGDDQSTDSQDLTRARQLRAKLELRRRKRKNHMKVFDIDSYVNELIDREKMSAKAIKVEKQFHENPSQNQNQNGSNQTEEKEADDVIFFENETLQASGDKSCEIIAVKRVLDRFKFARPSNASFNSCYNDLRFMPIGVVNFRNDDFKCIFSPLTKKVLKPYIRRDYESVPKKLSLNFQILTQKCTPSLVRFERYSIDYVYLRPEHVLQINAMCEQHFWSGIDISECLHYSDYTVVALYRKLIVGFAFLVPNLEHHESYLSFIFVHPDWRNAKESSNSNSVSVAQYMLFHLLQINKGFDVTLHVSVNSPAVIFYRKFGFRVEEFIKNFYDKYYSDTQSLSKDAFLMRLSRS